MTWPAEGVVILRGLLPDDLIDAYATIRAPMGPIGWPDCTPYMRYAEIRDLCLCAPLVEAIEATVGEAVGLHLNLTNWISTERTWHQDFYLNPPYVGDGYCGVWMALDDIDPRSGPFEYVAGSHAWEPLTREATLAQLRPEERADPNWPRLAERFVTAHWDRAIERHGAYPDRFDAKRGDVLLWHPKVVHRGSMPEAPGMERRSLIAHYSSIRTRLDMPSHAPWSAGRYFVL
jgi:ectoine hydroxylase-related dioxygenase (phytanoyl-CoA dioxygenase family)